MLNIDDYLNDNPEPQAGAYYFLRDTQDDVLAALEGLLADLVGVQNFAQFRKAIADRRGEIAAMLSDRERARAILRGED